MKKPWSEVYMQWLLDSAVRPSGLFTNESEAKHLGANTLGLKICLDKSGECLYHPENRLEAKFSNQERMLNAETVSEAARVFQQNCGLDPARAADFFGCSTQRCLLGG